jgi:ATP-dependent Clp protease ATP-binding subunit ClpC
MREEFTDRLRTALDKAQDEARRLNQEFVGTEHLLLGLLMTDASEASDGLRRAGIGRTELHERLVASLPHGGEAPVVTGKLPLSPKAHEAVNAAIVNAQAAGSSRVSSRLLLAALLDERETAVRSAMRESGADLDHLHRVLTQDGTIQPEK